MVIRSKYGIDDIEDVVRTIDTTPLHLFRYVEKHNRYRPREVTIMCTKEEYDKYISEEELKNIRRRMHPSYADNVSVIVRG